MSIGSLLNISKDALLTYQLAIDVTGSNIANVDTPGYSRQRPVFQSQGNVDVSSLRVQIGVEVTEIERIYDNYLNNRVADQFQVVGYNESKSDVLERIETIFAEDGGGAGDLTNRFWNAWSQLAVNPGGQVERENLLAAAENLTSMFRRLESDLVKVVRDAGDSISDNVLQVNDYLAKIADLNGDIVAAGAKNAGDGNILRDRRLELLNKLGKLADIAYLEDVNGATNIFLANGKPLLLGNEVRQLQVKQGSSIDVVYKDDRDVSLKQVLMEGKKGKIAAFLEISETIVPGYREKLDALASAFVSEVNAQHRLGYDGYGSGGGDFFMPAADARSFKVSSAVASDVKKIAASSSVHGDGDNALALGALKDRYVMNGGTATVSDAYASLIGRIGRDVADAKTGLVQQAAIMEQLSNRREATSGVSLDEEMMNLIKYQMAYNAAGKMVNTVNQMMETLLQLKQ